MYYHPIIGVSIFVIAVIISFLFGRYLMNRNRNKYRGSEKPNKNNLPKGEITSPDAPWLNKN